MCLRLGVLARNLFVDWYGGSTRTNKRLLIEVAKASKELEVELVPMVDEVYWMAKRGKVSGYVINKWADLYEDSGLAINERLLKGYVNGNLHEDPASIYAPELNGYDVLYDPILMPWADPRPSAQLQQIVSPFHVDLLYLKRTLGKLMTLLIGAADIPLKHRWLSRFAMNYGFLRPREIAGLSLFIARSKSLLSALARFRERVLLLLPSPGVLKNVDVASEFKSVTFYPFYAVDERVLSVPSGEKEDYLVFFSRGDVTKGVLEVPRILKLMRRHGCSCKLKVVSGFADEGTKRAFLRLADAHGVRDLVELYGSGSYVPDEYKGEMFKAVSKALLTLDPSHADVVPNVIVESLFLRTPVVAYDIPGPYEVFKKAKAVSFVPEFNAKEMALTACNLLRRRDIDSLFDDERTKEITKLHRDWGPIAHRFVSILMDFYEGRPG
jgi:glycosyltransferase involved in cell wall biosynthesis